MVDILPENMWIFKVSNNVNLMNKQMREELEKIINEKIDVGISEIGLFMEKYKDDLFDYELTNINNLYRSLTVSFCYARDRIFKKE
jgi:hypothetical protein